ncbi:MAG: hypothetical protein IT458_11435 [Planctomycetes bacterium]|nr:hypothetical protein [Planctomycetota bacterium]
MKKRFKELLHHYKVEAFKISHGSDQVAENTREILRFTDEALNNAYHYHFHKLPETQRVETFNMIKNFVLEAILPPVMEKVVRRLVVLEKQHTEMVRLLGDILEVLSDDRHIHDSEARTG